MQNFFHYFLVFLGILSFSFVSWRRLKEDYLPDQIFSTTALFLVGGFLGFVIFGKWLPQLSFLGFIFGSVLFGVYAVRKFEIKLFEALDSLVLGLLWFSIFAFGSIIVRFGWGVGFVNLLGLLPGVVSILVYTVFLKKYRRFSWYPSGKIGFIGASVSLVYFTLRALVAIYQFWVLSSASRLADSLVALLVSLFFGGFIYFRSGRIGLRRFKLFSGFQRIRKKVS